MAPGGRGGAAFADERGAFATRRLAIAGLRPAAAARCLVVQGDGHFPVVGVTDDHATGHKSIIGQFLRWAKATGPTYPQDPSGALSGALTIRLVQ